MITAAVLVDELRQLGGTIILLVDCRGSHLKVQVPAEANWLLAELKRRKPAVVAELRRRYLQKSEVRWVQ